MIKRISLLLLHFCFLFNVSAQTYQVGHLQQTFVDPARSNRNITTEIYYPANTAGDNVPIANGQFPVLVFGHGFVMVWSSYDVVWNALVPQGYIMVFPTTETSFSPSHTDFGKDIAFLIGAMKTEGNTASSNFFGAVSPTSAAMGHSMGGGSAFLAMQYDSSITALATLAAAVTNPSSVTAAASITKPSIVIAGENDCVAPPAQHQQLMYDALISTCKSFVSVTGGSHCQFADNDFLCQFGEATCSPQPTITAQAQQATTFSLLLPWLNFYLKNDCASGDEFQNLISAGNGITSAQNCSLICTGVEEKIGLTSFSIFPNPVEGIATVFSKQFLSDAELFIYDAAGKKVKVLKNISGYEMKFDISDLCDGFYFITLSQKEKLASMHKFIIAE